jgi:NAD-dependent DNA ligase
MELQITNFLKQITDRGNYLSDAEINTLEKYIETCDASLRESQEEGVETLVEDSIYEALVDILKEVRPESSVLTKMWSDDSSDEDLDTSNEEVDYLRLRREHPMLSINTIKQLTYDKLKEFISALPYADDEPFDLMFSMKENGHGTEVVLTNGDIYWGGSRARSAVNIKDLTRQFKIVLKNQEILKDKLSDLDMCSIRGEYVLPYANFEKARSFNPSIKTVFSGVSSMIKASASDEEIELLEFVAYGFHADGVEFDSDEDMYNFLDELGFITPLAYIERNVTKDTVIEVMEQVIETMEQDDAEYEYFTDGVVCSINDRRVLKEMGTEPNGKYLLGRVALKVGHWKQDSYSGIVYGYDWTDGRGKFSPVAIVVNRDFDDDDLDFNPSADENKVPTASGNRVNRVPLYEPANILQLGAYKHSTIFFRYGGESGVVPCYPNGVALEKNFVANLLKSDYY